MNSSNGSKLPLFYNAYLLDKTDWLPIVLYTLFFGVTFVGNLLIVFTVCSSKAFRKPVNYLIGNLAFSALLFTIFTSLYLLERNVHIWPESTNGFFCQFLASLHRLPVPAENFTVMLISIDRSKVMENPLGKERKGRALFKIASTWIFSLILVLPASATSIYDESLLSTYKCKKVLLGDSFLLHTIYISTYSFLGHVFPSIVLIRELFKLNSQLNFLRKNESDRRVGIIKNAMIFNGIYILLECPLIVLLFPYLFPESVISPLIITIAKSYMNICFFILFIHAPCYPLILFLLSSQLRRHFGCKCQKCCSAPLKSNTASILEKEIAVPDKISGGNGCSLKLLSLNARNHLIERNNALYN